MMTPIKAKRDGIAMDMIARTGMGMAVEDAVFCGEEEVLARTSAGGMVGCDVKILVLDVADSDGLDAEGEVDNDVDGKKVEYVTDTCVDNGNESVGGSSVGTEENVWRIVVIVPSSSWSLFLIFPLFP